MDRIEASPYVEKMRNEGLPSVAIDAFVRSLAFVSEGGQTEISEAEIEPVASLPSLETVAGLASAGTQAMARAVVIKLNGGLGTSMGLSRAKSLLEVRSGLTFLDLIARQILHQRAASESPIPFLLMNSYRTRDDSLAILERYPELPVDGMIDFLQHKVPRIDCETGRPVVFEEDPSLEWCPPGHGDLYIALKASGLLDSLLARGLRYAFVSNADNLGAVLDPSLLGWMATENIPFVMEVAERGAGDRKGGHLAMRDGQLVLRETAQCPANDRGSFEDIARHRFFNTNNLWIDLRALDLLFEADSVGPLLPVMTNEKHVRSTDPSSPRCLQLETAMGAAIESFPGARAIVVPRARFSPVKTTNDLLAVRSDAFELTPDHRLVAVETAVARNREIDLDRRYFASVGDLDARFPHGPPSLARARRFVVNGDYRFGAGVVVEGDVHLPEASEGPVEVPSGKVLGA